MSSDRHFSCSSLALKKGVNVVLHVVFIGSWQVVLLPHRKLCLHVKCDSNMICNIMQLSQYYDRIPV